MGLGFLELCLDVPSHMKLGESPVKIDIPEVRFLAALEVDQFDRAPLEKLYNAGVPSERFIISALQPT